jgi:probable addiction module antidote protein
MPKRTTEYRKTLLNDLANPAEASAYLNAARDDSPEMLLTALRDVAEVHHMATVAETAGVSRESLYRMLTSGGNPTYHNFWGILKAMGLEFRIGAIDSEHNPDERLVVASTKAASTKQDARTVRSRTNGSYRRRHKKTIPIDSNPRFAMNTISCSVNANISGRSVSTRPDGGAATASSAALSRVGVSNQKVRFRTA